MIQSTMEASLILIGDELVDGKVDDINGRWLAEKLFLQGISTREIRLIKDDLPALSAALSQCWERSDVIITTGGLGPTADDKTKDILSDFFSSPLQHHPAALEMVKKHYQRRNRPLPPENTYHRLPMGFSPLFNPCGLAPGLFLEKKGKILAALPGVPREMRMMAEQSLFPSLPTALGPERLVVRTRGLTEEDIFLAVCPGLWERLSPFGKVSSLPTPTGIDLHVTLSPTASSKELKTLFSASPLNDYIWQWGDLSLPALVLKEMKEQGLTVALAESTTGGLASSLLTDVPGSSESFAGGVITYNNRQKKQLLAVPDECLQSHNGPVNIDTARAMAEGVQKLFASDLAVSITGFAGPPPSGTVVIGTAAKGGSSEAHEYHFNGNREQCKEKFALTAFFALRSRIGVD